MFARSVVAVIAAVLWGCLSEDGDGGDGEKKSAVGESCARTADCESGAQCLEQVCRSGSGNGRGESCTRTADCTSGRRCVNHECIAAAGDGGVCFAGDAVVDPVCVSDDGGVETCDCPREVPDYDYDYGIPDFGVPLPEEPIVNFASHRDTLNLRIMRSAENGPYLFGLAETGNGAMGWYGEDCIDGVSNGADVCHSVPEGGELTLTHVDSVSDVGETTTLAIAAADGLTYVLIRDTAEYFGCWTWGHNTSFYRDPPLSCIEITPYSP